jgi:hypothetical protein
MAQANRQMVDIEQLVDRIIESSVMSGDGASLARELQNLREPYCGIVASSRLAIGIPKRKHDAGLAMACVLRICGCAMPAWIATVR